MNIEIKSQKTNKYEDALRPAENRLLILAIIMVEN